MIKNLIKGSIYIYIYVTYFYIFQQYLISPRCIHISWEMLQNPHLIVLS